MSVRYKPGVVDGDRVFCTGAGGGSKRVPVARFWARDDQWRAVLAQIKTSPVTGPAEY